MESLYSMFDRIPVPSHAHPHNDASSDLAEERMMPERFPRMNIADMHLDKRPLARAQRIAQRDRRVRPRACVDHDARRAVCARGVDAVQQDAFVVRLQVREGACAQLVQRQVAQVRQQLEQRRRSISF